MTIAESEPGTRAFIARSAWLRDEGLRLDATTYAAGGLEARDRMMSGAWPWQQLGELAQLFNGPRFARTYVQDPTRGTPFLSSTDILLADLTAVPLLSNAATPGLARLLVRDGWTLISCSGTIGNTAYVRPELAGMAASQHVMRAAPNDGVVAGYLFAFLSSAPAQAMIRQRTYGSVIQHIEPHHIADLPVPLPEPAEQERIHRLVVGAAEARTEASRLLGETAAYFNRLAGPMAKLHDHARAAGVVRCSNLGSRLDSFHHVGWATEAFLDGDHLGAIATVAVPGRMKLIHAREGAPFFTGVDLYQTRPNSTKSIARWIPGFDDLVLKAGTVLIQIDGQRYGLMGRPVYAGRRVHGAAASWHLARIRSEQTARVYAFASSEVGRRAIVRQSFGTSVPSITAQLLTKVRVPPLPGTLVAKVDHALELREQADMDEERAIREVEAWLA